MLRRGAGAQWVLGNRHGPVYIPSPGVAIEGPGQAAEYLLHLVGLKGGRFGVTQAQQQRRTFGILRRSRAS